MQVHLQAVRQHRAKRWQYKLANQKPEKKPNWDVALNDSMTTITQLSGESCVDDNEAELLLNMYYMYDTI